VAVISAGCDPDEYPSYLELLGRMIKAGLAHKNVPVLKKYLWLHGRYVRAVEEVQQFSKQRDYDAEQQRLHIIGLPLYEAQADAARKKIETGIP